MKVLANGKETEIFEVSEFGDDGWTDEYGIDYEGFEDVTFDSIMGAIEALIATGITVVV